MKAPSLSELQSWMQWVLTDPRGVEDALQNAAATDILAPGRYKRPKRDCLSSIIESPSATRIERLDVYAEGYFSRLLGCLKDQFPTVSKVLDDSGFRKIAADYLEVHPSLYFNIEEVGCELSEFLKTHRYSGKYPFLSDLARLDWAVISAFYSLEKPLLDPRAFQAVSLESWEHALCRLNPSIELLQLEYRVAELWSSDQSLPISKTETYLIVQKREKRIHLLSINQNQHAVLSAFAARKSLGRVLTEMETRISSAEVLDWFSEWIRNGVIAEIDFRKE